MATRQCGWCLNPYEHQPRPRENNAALGSALLVCESDFAPDICDGCFTMVVEAAPRPEVVNRAPIFLLRMT